jgi:hypothetical protein
VQTFLSDLEAPDLVHPVVYSPYGSVHDDRSGSGYAKVAYGAACDRRW